MRPENARSPRVWALLGAHRGDNNQVLALAERLGWPFETKLLRYTALRRLDVRLLGASLASLTHESRALLDDDLPDLVIAVGHRSTPVVRALRARSGGRCKLVHLGNPRADPSHFDLVITTPQYPVRDCPNVIRFPLALGRPKADASGDDMSKRILAALSHPRRLLILGGPTRYWRLESDDVVAAIATLIDQCRADDGSLAVLGSPRTPPAVLRAAGNALAGASVPVALIPIEGPPSYSELLAAADAVFISADSVAMISEALRTEKPIGLVPVRRTRTGNWRMTMMDRIRPGRPLFPRDLRYFWTSLERQGLAGTVQQPGTGCVPDVVEAAAARVRQLLELPLPPAPDGRDGDRSAPENPA